ncbi:ribosome small subunit-dependent GTPase A [Pseudovibrio exalbescens]|uniref:ribosome small subunit-dependent GTPase A n=1 Tax=Pseudovibrio exalbescens TaxID=197461 RepID=UPI0023659A6D|nr:ribosome small subunit-dependent GTPase A [Pseudovibrio exalbescens]MDD7910854.1 ribosome small subunit-dependent GTPase A [Pseudovibrio exalbescens]
MTRDYSAYVPKAPLLKAFKPMTLLATLGWQPFFAQQTSVEEMETSPPVRVTAVHRSGVDVKGEGIEEHLPVVPNVAVGDWLMLNKAYPPHSRILERKSLFKRKAPGRGWDIQLIAANVDTVFVVTSCNQDFNRARLERFVALATDSDAQAVLVLTKADLCDAPQTFVDEARLLGSPVVLLDARGPDVLEKLGDWLKPGQTLAFLGSSGVGKSTLVNAISGHEIAATRDIREDDSKGRHTTTHRQLHILPAGFCLMDTPGMREIQLADVQEGLSEVFSDIEELVGQCRFSDCQHKSEPGCAVRPAIEGGVIEQERYDRWQKLVQEERSNSEVLAQRKSKNKRLSKTIRQMKKQKAK